MSADEGTAFADQMRADIRSAGCVSAKALIFAGRRRFATLFCEKGKVERVGVLLFGPL